MSRLLSPAQLSITISGKEVPLNTSYRNALLTWNAMEAAHTGELSPLATASIAMEKMLGLDVGEMEDEEINSSLKDIADYLQKYARVSDTEKKDNKPPLLDLDQDAVMLFDAYMSMGVDLDAQEISYPRFMSLLRELPKDAQICRIIYLRQQHRAGKLTKEEKAECYRRGWDVIKLRNRAKEKAAADNKDYFKEKQNELRAARGLPPI